MTSQPASTPLRVLVAGAGVAGLETMIALHELAGERVQVTLLTPDSEFVYRPMSVLQPFAGPAPDARPLARIAADLGAGLRQASLSSVDPAAHVAVTSDGDELPYDVLVLTLGARRSQPFGRVTTFADGRDSERVHGVVQDVEAGYTNSVDFLVPPGVTWPLPLYEIALMTAHRARDMGMSPVLRMISPEAAPLVVF